MRASRLSYWAAAKSTWQRLFLLLLSFTLVGNGLIGCSYQGWKGTIKLGFVGPFSGYDAGSAYAAYRALELAVREWNGRGGVGGYRVEIVALDDQNTPLVAARQAREMAADSGVLGVVGYLGAEAAAAAEEVHGAVGLPALVLAPGWEGAAPAGVLRLGPSLAAEADGAHRLLTGRPLAVIYEQAEPDGKGLAEKLARMVARRAQLAGGQVVAEIGLGLYDRDWKTLARRLRSSGAKAVFYSGGFERAASFWAAERESLEGLEIVVGCQADTPDFHRLGRDRLSGVLYLSSTLELSGDSAKRAQFESNYLALTGEKPQGRSYLAYDAATFLLLAAASEAAAGRPPSRAGVLHALPRIGQQRGVGRALDWEPGRLAEGGRVPAFRLGPDGYPGRREVQ